MDPFQIVNINSEYAPSTVFLQYAAPPLQLIWTEMMKFVTVCCTSHASLASLTVLAKHLQHTQIKGHQCQTC